VVNNLALYKTKQDLKFLAAAKKSVDSLITTKADSADLKKSVYKVVVYSTIINMDTLNTLKNPANFLDKTAQLVDKISEDKKISRFSDQMDYVDKCLANVYIRQGFKFLAISDFTNGKRVFLKAKGYAPKFKSLNLYLAFCNNKLGNLEDAAKYYDEVSFTDTTAVQYLENAANLYKSIGDTSKAIDLLQKGRGAAPNDRFLLINLANIYNNQQNYIALQPLLPQLLDNYPNNGDIAFIAANCYDHLNQYTKAENLYLKAIDLNGSAYEPILNLGLLYLKLGFTKKGGEADNDTDEAMQYLEKANEILPNDINALKALQLVYTRTKNDDKLNDINDKIKQLTNQ
jgi:tetratricopeptide (TPR) repeat protein